MSKLSLPAFIFFFQILQHLIPIHKGKYDIHTSALHTRILSPKTINDIHKQGVTLDALQEFWVYLCLKSLPIKKIVMWGGLIEERHEILCDMQLTEALKSLGKNKHGTNKYKKHLSGPCALSASICVKIRTPSISY